MVERVLRRPKRILLRRHLPPPPRDKPVPHIPKKPMLASTGTKVDRLCAICLGKLGPGDAITFCKCGKFFHLDCISEVKICPLCQYETEFSHVVVDDSPVPDNQMPQSTAVNPDEAEYEEIYEEVFQCPLCEAYVDDSAAECRCGAQFDTEEEIYTCPDCEAEVEPDATECPNCGMTFQ